MKEAAVVISVKGEPLFWHCPADRTIVSLPDSASLWDVLWQERERLAGVAHTHPGGGVPGPSLTDVTTFSAIERGMGRRLLWWIASSDALVAVHWTGPEKFDYGKCVVDDEPEWLAELRRLSYAESLTTEPATVTAKPNEEGVS